MATKFIVIYGPTASGKTALALQLAQKINAVIVNSDSQQVYKELQILSARPTKQEEAIAPHRLFGHISGAESYSTGHWLKDAKQVLLDAKANNQPAILVGGTGLYIKALIEGMVEIPAIPEEIKAEVRRMKDEVVASKLGEYADINPRRNTRALEVFLATGKHLKDWQKDQPKSDFSIDDFLIFVMNVPRETLYQKINIRFEQMIKSGAIDEVKELRKLNLSPAAPIMKAIGVPEIISYLDGHTSLEDVINIGQQFTRNYAKRQLTWARQQIPADKKIEAQDLSFDEILSLTLL